MSPLKVQALCGALLLLCLSLVQAQEIPEFAQAQMGGPGIPKPYFNEYIGANTTGSSSASANASAILKGLEASDATWTEAILVNTIFTLAYAQEAPDAVGQGNFSAMWDDSITPELIEDYKRARTGTKFLASLGGPTLSNGSNYVFQPQPGDCSAWSLAAAESAADLIYAYNLDGIGIDFQNFDAGDNSFSTCIAALITALRTAQSPVEVMVAISPSGSTQTQYGAVYTAAASYVDLVNFQAYDSSPSSVADYQKLYASISPYPYPSDKLLLGVLTTTANSNGSIVDAFLDLYSQQKIRGASFFEAETSAPDFIAENAISEALSPS